MIGGPMASAACSALLLMLMLKRVVVGISYLRTNESLLLLLRPITHLNTTFL
jgi:hypothetical protein